MLMEYLIFKKIMSFIGLDFDNTLVCYDSLFYEIAVGKI